MNTTTSEYIDEECAAIARGEEPEPSNSTSVEVREKAKQDGGIAPAPPKTAAELRVDQVNAALEAAYTTQPNITKEEAAILTRPFPDDEVEVLPDSGLIYIPHALISRRLTEALGPGNWSIIKRQQERNGNQIFCEYVLLVRGAYVGEAPAGANYYPDNRKQTLDDVYEGTQGVALRRICGKSSLQCGSQVWEPAYARKWCKDHREEFWQENWRTKKKEKRYRRNEGSFAPQEASKPSAPATPKTAKKPSSVKSEPRMATFLGQDGNIRTYEQAEKEKPSKEPVSDTDGGIDGVDDLEAWRLVESPVAFGTDLPTGTAINDIRDEDGKGRKRLFSLWANYKPRKDDSRAVAFRTALDDAGEHYGFKKGEK